MTEEDTGVVANVVLDDFLWSLFDDEDGALAAC